MTTLHNIFVTVTWKEIEYFVFVLGLDNYFLELTKKGVAKEGVQHIH